MWLEKILINTELSLFNLLSKKFKLTYVQKVLHKNWLVRNDLNMSLEILNGYLNIRTTLPHVCFTQFNHPF